MVWSPLSAPPVSKIKKSKHTWVASLFSKNLIDAWDEVCPAHSSSSLQDYRDRVTWLCHKTSTRKVMSVREKLALKDDGVALAASTKTIRGSIHGESWRGVVVPKQDRTLHMAARSPASKP